MAPAATAMLVIKISDRFEPKHRTTYNPESKPCPVEELKGEQGFAKLDWVTVWFFCMNWNVIVSPTWAVMFAGWNARLGPPTTTLWSVDMEFEGAGEEAEDDWDVAGVLVPLAG